MKLIKLLGEAGVVGSVCVSLCTFKYKSPGGGKPTDVCVEAVFMVFGGVCIAVA